MKDRTDVRIAMEESLFEEFTEPLGFGDDLAPLIRDAIQKKLARNPELEEEEEEEETPDASEEKKDKGVTVPMEQELKDEIASHLDFGQHYAEWIRQAMREEIDRRETGGNGRIAIPAAD